MKCSKLFTALVIGIFCLIHGVFSQIKKEEKEKRVDCGKIPTNSQSLLAPYLKKAKKIKCYYEVDGDHKSYECKFRYDQKQYSIEFDQQGKLEDIEVIVEFNNLPDHVKSEISSYYNSFDDFKLYRIQKQYSDTVKSDEMIVQRAFQNEGNIIRYEIETGLKQEKRWSYFEILFDEQGRLIQQRSIIRRSSDHILY